jgi:hypothetical protein
MQLSYPTWKWLLIGSGFLLLLTMLFFPFGYDQVAFMVGGEMTIKHGAIPYRDFLDTKPPIIFMIYGIASVLFGHHEWSIRIFDIIFQIGTLFYFFTIIKRFTGDEKLALSSVFLYVLFYTTSGYWMTAQAETFALLPALIVFDITERVREKVQSPKSGVRSQDALLGIYAGLACAILFLLKFTFLTVPIGAVIYLLLESKKEKSFPWKYIFGSAIGFILLTGLYAIYLIVTGTMDQFMESIVWLRDYAAINPLLSSDTIRERYYKMYPIALVVAFSITGLLVASIGILKYFKNRVSGVERPSTIDNRLSTSPPSTSAFLHFFIQFTLGLAAVLYERKFFPYHFSRVYWAFVPFVALGLREFAGVWKNYTATWKNLTGLQKNIRYLAALILVCILLFFSSATRIVSQPLHWVYMHLTGADVGANMESLIPQYYYKEEQTLAAHLRPMLKPEEQIFVWGNSIGIYYFLEKYPTTICLTNTPLVTPWTPETWKTTVIKQLTAKPPRFIIIEFGDERCYLTSEEVDSWQHLQTWKELKEFVANHYEMKDTLGHFRIFELR